MNQQDRERFEEIMNHLDPADRRILERHREEMLENAIRAAIPAVMARNLSHPKGSNVRIDH